MSISVRVRSLTKLEWQSWTSGKSVERIDDDVNAMACAMVVDCTVMCICVPHENPIGVGVGLCRLTEREPVRVVVQREQHPAVAHLVCLRFSSKSRRASQVVF